MARADLLKKLFRGYRHGDGGAFIEAAKEIVEDERKKQHNILADDLTRILNNGVVPGGVETSQGFEVVPKDPDRGTKLLEIRRPDRYLSDLVLSSYQEGILEEVMAQFRQWEVLEANGLRPSNKLLFCGPPGCGKTASAEAVSCELGLPLLYVRFDAVVSSLLGETAANLGKVFDYASRDTWVLLFDEFDAIGRSRDDATEHGELKRVVNAFLQMLDRFTGRSLVIAATNFEQALDPALWRRFDEIIRFEKPERKQIVTLLEKKLGGKRNIGFDVSFLAEPLEGMSHAEIERVCLDALKRCALKGQRKPSREDVELSLKRQEHRKQALAKSRSAGAPVVEDG